MDEMSYNGTLMEADEKEAQGNNLLEEARILRNKAKEMGWKPAKVKEEPEVTEPQEEPGDKIEVKTPKSSTKDSKFQES